MKSLWQKLGTAAFWASWPLLWIYLRVTKRTRLLLVCGDEFLAVRGWLSSGKWGLPGGGLRWKEDPHVGTLRELHEETNVVLTAKQLRFMFEKRYKEYGLPIDCYCFFAEIKKKPSIKPRLFEITDVHWLPLKNKESFTKDAASALSWWQNPRNASKKLASKSDSSLPHN
ncbi:MAG: NUDIX hydrolase [Patescibacteria group bacterium]